MTLQYVLITVKTDGTFEEGTEPMSHSEVYEAADRLTKALPEDSDIDYYSFDRYRPYKIFKVFPDGERVRLSDDTYTEREAADVAAQVKPYLKDADIQLEIEGPGEQNG